MKKLKLQLFSIVCALAAFAGLNGSEFYPDHVTPQQAQEKIAKKAARVQVEQDAYKSGLEGKECRQASKQNLQGIDSQFNAAVNLETTHQKAWHFATGVSPRGDHVYLEDNSGWNVRKSDAHKTLDWYGSDAIALTLTPWYSWYDFALVNGRTGAKVYVDLNEVPEDANAYTLWITNIDHSARRITLCDNSVWEVSIFDAGIVSTWEIAQKVIIGVNERGFFSQRFNFLLNQDERNYVKTDCLYGQSN